jgi:hypothetical protein
MFAGIEIRMPRIKERMAGMLQKLAFLLDEQSFKKQSVGAGLEISIFVRGSEKSESGVFWATARF